MSGKLARNVSTPENQAWWDCFDAMTRRERDTITEIRRDINFVRPRLRSWFIGCRKGEARIRAIERICDAAEKWLQKQEQIFPPKEAEK